MESHRQGTKFIKLYSILCSIGYYLSILGLFFPIILIGNNIKEFVLGEPFTTMFPVEGALSPTLREKLLGPHIEEMSKGGIKLSSIEIKGASISDLSILDVLINNLWWVIWSILAFIVAQKLRNLFLLIKEKKSFTDQAIKLMRLVGFIMIGWYFLELLAVSYFNNIFKHAMDKVFHDFSGNSLFYIAPPLASLGLGILLLAFAEVFNYGRVLQDENDLLV